ncbi:hypothetical protein CDEST_15365 [Colletotrichum destructivum]|uniref:Transposase n=1 Tax=Colletotrichum destructivum TaxID=34406 RepID=A0AAX4J4Q4_9PEZI|nr:hypothetical protein CDEST_15365 [Colletotrichum destructivum]
MSSNLSQDRVELLLQRYQQANRITTPMLSSWAAPETDTRARAIFRTAGCSTWLAIFVTERDAGNGDTFEGKKDCKKLVEDLNGMPDEQISELAQDLNRTMLARNEVGLFERFQKKVNRLKTPTLQRKRPRKFQATSVNFV